MVIELNIKSNIMATNNGSTLEIGQSNQDLIFTKGNKQKRIWLTILSVLLIMALVLICAYLLFGSSDTVQTAALTLSREDILRGKFVAERFNGTWISDTELLYRADGIVKYNVETGEKTVIIPQSNKLLEF